MLSWQLHNSADQGQRMRGIHAGRAADAQAEHSFSLGLEKTLWLKESLTKTRRWLWLRCIGLSQARRAGDTELSMLPPWNMTTHHNCGVLALRSLPFCAKLRPPGDQLVLLRGRSLTTTRRSRAIRLGALPAEKLLWVQTSDQVLGRFEGLPALISAKIGPDPCKIYLQGVFTSAVESGLQQFLFEQQDAGLAEGWQKIAQLRACFRVDGDIIDANQQKVSKLPGLPLTDVQPS